MDKLSKNKIYIPIILVYVVIVIVLFDKENLITNFYLDIYMIVIGFILFYKTGNNLIKIREDIEAKDRYN